MLKYFFGNTGKVLKMPVLIGVKISNQSGNQDSAEKRKGNTQHLRSCKSKHGSESEISKNSCSQKCRNVGIEYRSK